MLTPRPTIRARLAARIRTAHEAVGYRIFMVSGAMYIAAASFIGWETLAVLVGYATMAPIAVPLTVAGIAAFALTRRLLRRRAASLGETRGAEATGADITESDKRNRNG